MITFKFERHSRLLKSADFQRTFKHSKLRSADKLLTMIVAKQEEFGPRIGLAIAKKQIRTAVGRNRIKRQLRERFRHNAEQLPNVDIVVMARAAAKTATRQELADSIDKHFQRIKKKCSPS